MDKAVLPTILEKIAHAANTSALEGLRIQYLGRKGEIAAAFAAMAQLTGDARKSRGQELNAIKQQIESAFEKKQASFGGQTSAVDQTLPGEKIDIGHLHPLTQFSRKVIEVWRTLGYDVHEGPELESSWYNFDGLNVPADHPARDVQDTFFVKDKPDLVLRTHSSTVQLRSVMHHAQQKPPVRYVEVGKVYRHEATDATHESMFMQCDGVLIDRHVTMAHLMTTLRTFIDRLYPGAKIRFRPSFFPFVEPGIELDMWWERPGKEGKWLEILGAGLVHPNVLKAMGLKSTEWQGFAFGMGLDRLAMLDNGVPDIRLFYNGNLEFLKQF